MKDIIVGQVLSLKIRFNNNGVIAPKKHPYLVVEIDKTLGIVEIAQLDTLAGKEYKAARKSNKVIYCDNPFESVIDKDSYIQLDNSFQIEYFEGLTRYRRQTDTLSECKLAEVLAAYRKYHEENEIDEAKIVFMSKSEILRLNPLRNI